MASACVNKIRMSPENFLLCPLSTKCNAYGRLRSPRTSFSREIGDDDSRSLTKASSRANSHSSAPPPAGSCGDYNSTEGSDLDVLCGNDMAEFEFRIDGHPQVMLPADELFSGGKLVQLQTPTNCQGNVASAREPPSAKVVGSPPSAKVVGSPPDTPKRKTKNGNSSFSKSPRRCSTASSGKWKELLGFKKIYQHEIGNVKGKDDCMKTTTSSSLSSPSTSNNGIHKSMKNFIRRSSSKSLNSLLSSMNKGDGDNKSLRLPLLKGSNNDNCGGVSISCHRLSLSSSSSPSPRQRTEGLPRRLSLDSQKPASLSRKTAQTSSNRRKTRFVVRRGLSAKNVPSTAGVAARVGRRAPGIAAAIGGFSPDSPRMNSSGKVIFHGLERSSSSPAAGTCIGEARYKSRGMARSYSGNVRVTPIINVPVCSSLRGSSKAGAFGFPIFCSSPKKEATAAGSNGGNGIGNHKSLLLV
ncbi:unnamed protein product [Cuscuta europaea]|uniref:Uncharacterized protein n=1 Tax=Cuscuta europaea TaxID=41803 RepID=A0A9P1E3G7_CUSEU|nr:unnamed protein product [Cuscuta europaea]